MHDKDNTHRQRQHCSFFKPHMYLLSAQRSDSDSDSPRTETTHRQRSSDKPTKPSQCLCQCWCNDSADLPFRSAELDSPGRLPSDQHHQIHLAYKLRAFELVEVEADVQHGLQCHKVGRLVKKDMRRLRCFTKTGHVTSPCLCLCSLVRSDIIVQLSSTACWNASFLDQR